MSSNKLAVGLALALRIVIGGIFVYAAWLKLQAPWPIFAMNIDSSSFCLCPPLNSWLTLPWLELLLGAEGHAPAQLPFMPHEDESRDRREQRRCAAPQEAKRVAAGNERRLLLLVGCSRFVGRSDLARGRLSGGRRGCGDRRRVLLRGRRGLRRGCRGLGHAGGSFLGVAAAFEGEPGVSLHEEDERCDEKHDRASPTTRRESPHRLRPPCGGLRSMRRGAPRRA